MERIDAMPLGRKSGRFGRHRESGLGAQVSDAPREVDSGSARRLGNLLNDRLRGPHLIEHPFSGSHRAPKCRLSLNSNSAGTFTLGTLCNAIWPIADGAANDPVTARNKYSHDHYLIVRT